MRDDSMAIHSCARTPLGSTRSALAAFSFDRNRSLSRREGRVDALTEARFGDVLGGESLIVTLAMMAARDTDNPDNPIHSDPDSARAAGLKKPIARGSHVQSFALELLMAGFGARVLLHGTYVD